MRNLKKVLSLVLCLAVMMSVMVVGASAATFSDEDQIANPEATFLLNALGIVEGRENGAFDGTASITRAEASKLIACLNLKGQPVPQANGAATFADVLTSNTSKWAIDYIEYLVAQGSVNGLGNGNFGPDMKVTGVQFAKMLLGVLGYDPITEKFVGADWEYYTNTAAVKANLYVGLEKIDVTAPLTRDDAAQMMFNALMAKTVIYLTDTTGALKLTNKDLMQTLYPTVYWKFGKMTAIDYNTKTGVYTYTVGGDKIDSKTDYTGMFGENVMYVKDRIEDTLGVYSYKNTVETGLLGDVDFDDDAYAELKSVDLFSVDSKTDGSGAKKTTTNFTDVTVVKTERIAGMHDYYAYKAVDYDQDDEFDYMIVYPVVFEKVNQVNANRVLTDSVNTYFFENNTIYDGVAKKDFVVVSSDTTVKTVNVLEKIDAQSGIVNSINEKKGDITEIVIGGTAYDFCNTPNPGYVSGLDRISKPLHDWPGKTVDFYAYNGYVLCMQEDISLARDYLLITSINGDYNSDGRSVNATALFGDNTSKEITIASLDGKQGEAMRTEILAYMDQPQGKTNAYGQFGYLARYEVKADGSYALTSTYKLDQMVAAGAADLGFTNTAAVYNTNPSYHPATNNTEFGHIHADGKVVRIADDAQVFLVDMKNGNNSYSAVSGKDIVNMTGMTRVNYVGYELAEDGFYYATLVYIQTNVQYMSPAFVGFVVSDPEFKTVYEDGKMVECIYFDLFDGEKTVSIVAEPHPDFTAAQLHNIKAGHVVSLRSDGGMVQITDFVKGTNVAITALNTEKPYADIGLSANGQKSAEMPFYLTDDTQIIYVDSKKNVAAEGELAISDSHTIGGGKTYFKNAWAVTSGQDVVLLVVDSVNSYGFESGDGVIDEIMMEAQNFVPVP